MAKINEEQARLELGVMAEDFGVDAVALDGFLEIAMDGRLYPRDGSAVYVFLKPIKMGEDMTVTKLVLRQPVASDYIKYTTGLKVSTKSGEVDAADASKTAMRALVILGDQGAGVLDKMSLKDFGTLSEVCDALGFFI